jgi:hypothetical protein
MKIQTVHILSEPFLCVLKYNINEQKRYQFALLHYRAPIDNYIFEDEYYVGLRST